MDYIPRLAHDWGYLIKKNKKNLSNCKSTRAEAEQPGQLKRETVSLSSVAEVSWMLTCNISPQGVSHSVPAESPKLHSPETNDKGDTI